MKMFRYDGKTMSSESQQDQKTASRSKRVMLKERGSQPEHRKSRRFDRALARSKKAKNRYCNNIDNNNKIIKT